MAKTGTNGLARPSFIKAGDTRGAEHITRDDVRLPQLKLAQGISPQVTEGNAELIKDLKPGDYFNDLTKQIYGRGPLEFVVLRGDAPKYIEFVPRDQGTGIKDFDVKPGDPRTKFTTDPATGKSIKPAASKIYDFVIMLLPSMEMMTFSLSSASLKPATQLNAFIAMRNAPIFAGKYSITTVPKAVPKGTYYAHVIQNSAIESEFSAKDGDKVFAGWLNEETLAIAEARFEQMRDAKIDIKRDREPGDEDDFPTGEHAQPAGGGDM
jgi:hypothetical protein